MNDEYADASIVNVTGSNSVNVFLGLGFPWVVCCCLHIVYDFEYEDGTKGSYKMYAGSLGFSVAVFISCAIVALAILLWRRWRAGGELGGPPATCYATGFLFIGLWLVSGLLSLCYHRVLIVRVPRSCT
jgi:solute carrier family 8 (sodium/calcium exchanger)